MQPLYLNGRFTSQSITGVQRFACEITASLDRLWYVTDHRPTILMPQGPQQIPAYKTLCTKIVGRMRGHAWEQFELPIHARNGMLINLANSGPIAAERQIVVLHDAGIFTHPEAYSAPYRLLHKTLDKMLVRSQAKIATVSKFSRDEIARYLHIPSSDIEVIPEGADHILRVEPDDTILRQNGLTPGSYVLAVGSLAAHKNLSSLCDLAQMLSRRGLDLAVAGGVAAGVFDAGNVRLPRPAKYLGRVSDRVLRALYKEAACFVFPSRYEGFGIPPVEAMTCNCPVVAGKATAVTEICGDAVLYADPDDPLQITAAVRRVIDEPHLAATLRERGRERVRTLTWDNAASALIGVIERLQRSSAESSRDGAKNEAD